MAIVTSGAFPIDPYVDTGLVLTDKLNQLFAAIESNNLHSARPDYVTNGGTWAKDNGDGTATLMLFSNGLDVAVASSSDLSDKAPINSPEFTGNPTITTNNTAAALKITQTGTGNALLIEDSASPDNSPFVIDATGKVLIGQTINVGSELLQLRGTTANTPRISLENIASDNSPPSLRFKKSRNYGIVSIGDALGSLTFHGNDGASYLAGASISAYAATGVGANSMPADLIFNTTPVGGTTFTERMRIDSAGDVGIGQATPTAKLDVLSAHATEPAVRITQTGTGNALVVEDSASPDNSPFVIDASGRVIIGHTINVGSEELQIRGTTAYTPQMSLENTDAGTSSGYIKLKKSRNSGIVSVNDTLGTLRFYGHDGASYLAGASITAYTATGVGANSMPADLSFSTTPVGGAASLERMRIDSAGNVTVTAAQGTAANSLTRKDYVDSLVAGGSGGGATGGGTDKVFYLNDQVVTTDYTIPVGKNAMSAGPVTVNSGITVTVGAGQEWSIV